MTPALLAAEIRRKTITNSTTLSDSVLLPIVNDGRQFLSELARERAPEMFIIPQTFNLVADQREYALPSDILQSLYKAEAKFVSTDSYMPLVAVKNYKGSETESEIVKNFANIGGQAAYTIRRSGIFILSGTIIAVTNGGRLWVATYPPDIATDLTGTTDMSVPASTTSIGFPKPLHRVLAMWCSIQHKLNRPKPLKLDRFEENFDYYLEKALATLSQSDLNLDIIGELPSGADFGHDGMDY